MVDLYLCNKLLCKIKEPFSSNIKCFISSHMQLNDDEYYLLVNGKRIVDNFEICENNVHIVLKLNGGKGGFGSMLRAIGAQIEKTTNREACRDLSGRRLRDINEEKRLKNWIAAQAEREKEAEDRKQKKLERLCEEPKHEFNDEDYFKERAVLPEKIEDALAQGLKASTSSSNKRKSDEDDKLKKKKRKLWLDDDLDELSDELSEDEEEDKDKVEDLSTKSETKKADNCA